MTSSDCRSARPGSPRAVPPAAERDTWDEPCWPRCSCLSRTNWPVPCCREATCAPERSAIDAGMIPLWESACSAVDDGLTSPAEVRRILGVSQPPPRLEFATTGTAPAPAGRDFRKDPA